MLLVFSPSTAVIRCWIFIFTVCLARGHQATELKRREMFWFLTRWHKLTETIKTSSNGRSRMMHSWNWIFNLRKAGVCQSKMLNAKDDKKICWMKVCFRINFHPIIFMLNWFKGSFIQDQSNAFTFSNKRVSSSYIF